MLAKTAEIDFDFEIREAGAEIREAGAEIREA
jgi:hypothetical protein